MPRAIWLITSESLGHEQVAELDFDPGTLAPESTLKMEAVKGNGQSQEWAHPGSSSFWLCDLWQDTSRFCFLVCKMGGRMVIGEDL